MDLKSSRFKVERGHINMGHQAPVIGTSITTFCHLRQHLTLEHQAHSTTQQKPAAFTP
jgi:hypothetical protein